MDTEIIDSTILGKEESISHGKLIAFGVFLYLSIISTTITTNLILRDLLLNSDINEGVLFWVLQASTLGLTILILVVLIRKYRIKKFNKNSTLTKYIIIAISLFISTQVVQYIYTYFMFDIWNEGFIDKIDAYYRFLTDKHNWKLIQSLLEYVKYIVVGILLIKN